MLTDTRGLLSLLGSGTDRSVLEAAARRIPDLGFNACYRVIGNRKCGGALFSGSPQVTTCQKCGFRYTFENKADESPPPSAHAAEFPEAEANIFSDPITAEDVEHAYCKIGGT